MIKKNLIIYVFLFSIIKIYSQNKFIIAGIHDSTDYFYNVIPDTTFQGGYYSPVYYYMDINNDAIFDLKFSTSFQSNAGGFFGSGGVSLTILQGEVIKDTANSNFTLIINKNDSINNGTSWVSNTTLDISNYSYQNCPPLCPGFNTEINLIDSNKYLGYRIITPNDTLYGWIKFTVNSIQMTIEEWAIKLPSSGVKNNFLWIYPNPTTGIFIINSSENIASIEIINLLGENIYSSQINSEKVEIDLSTQPQGIYFLQVKTSNGTAVKKIVKE